MLSKCAAWLEAPELDALAAQFDGKIPQNTDFKQRLRWLVDFSRIWDFRSLQKCAQDAQTGENARWLLDGSGLTESQILAALKAASKLGMVDCELPAHSCYDAILVLGGARMSCFFRMKYAEELCRRYGVASSEITGLTAMRLIADSERNATDTYAPEAATEFDLMCEAAKKIFASAAVKSVKKELCENSNRSWGVMQFEHKIPLTVLAAASTEPDRRRANTADTFEFWAKQKSLVERERLLLVTSQIYVPYQQMEAIRTLGIPYGCSIETVGFPQEWSAHLQGLQTAVNYLQEIRSALLAMEKIIQEKENEQDK
ncbi:MAG: hypothetical protein NC417_08005 [Candidatus Gastranaerophilales bacterium]|nr:hypothetical protein [Candidatus Gastranaerophilales bacterium]